jgi:hypothetical protein
MNLWTRWWPLAGIAFVGLFIGGFAVTGSSPDSQDDDSKILAYYASKSHQHRDIAAFLMILGGCLLFVWFLAMLRDRLARSEQGGRWTALAFGSGLIAATLWIAADATFAATAFASNDTSKFHLDPNTFRLLNDGGYAVWVGGTTIALGVVTGTAIVALRTGLLPKWLCWLSFVVALTMLVSFFFFPFFAFCGWIIVVAVALLIRTEAPAAAPAPA